MTGPGNHQVRENTVVCTVEIEMEYLEEAHGALR